MTGARSRRPSAPTRRRARMPCCSKKKAEDKKKKRRRCCRCCCCSTRCCCFPCICVCQALWSLVPTPVQRRLVYCKRALCGCGCATDLYTAYFRWRYHEYVNFMIASDVNGTLTVLKNALDLDTRTLLRLLSTFRAIDEDESGMVDMVEFCDYFELDRHCPHKRLISRIFGTFDTDREGASSGQLDAAEFIVGMVRICTMRKDELCKFVFDLFDVDGSGELDKTEVALLARELLNADETSMDKKADAMIRAFDANNDGTLTLNEWQV